MKGAGEMYFWILDEHRRLFEGLGDVEDDVTRSAGLMAEAVKRGNKLLICGNGGSAADAQHFAAEIIGRFEMERKALPAIALNTDTSVLTALRNDGGELLLECDIAAVVPGGNTARIQEAHIFIIHFWAAWIEREIFGQK